MPKLLKRTVDALLRRGDEQIVWDDQLPGFGLRIRSGRGHYFVKYRFHGRQRWFTLGQHCEGFPPQKARDGAADALAKVRRGVDPAAEKRAEAAQQEAAALTFAKAAQRYLNEATGHLAATTREDRQRILREGAPLLRRFGAKRLAEISRRDLLEWWAAHFEKPNGLTRKTGRNQLDALSAVFTHAVDLETLESNPVDGLRAVLRRRNQTKGGRAQSSPANHICPIETADEIERLLEASAARPWIVLENRAGTRGEGHLLTLLLLDGGLRLGEALGLRWGDVRFGRDGSDLTRALVIRETLARGKHAGAPKNGHSRTVSLSRRLRTELLTRYLAAGRPSETDRVLPGVDHANYRKRHFARACAAAKIGARRPKDLRDTYASQLLTAGVQLGYLSAQLGHSDVAVTARHYARWAGTEYRAPLQIAEGEVPADLLARLAKAKVDVIELAR